MAAVDFKTHFVLVSKDGDQQKVSRSAAQMLGLVKSTTQDSAEGDEVKLPVEVDKDTLRLVIEYIEEHKDSKAEKLPQPLDKPIDQLLSEWDKVYLNTKLLEGGDIIKHQKMLNVMSAAHYFDCEDLLNLTCAAAASFIQDKNPEEIRKFFNLPDDFTPEQKSRNAEELKALSDL